MSAAKESTPAVVLSVRPLGEADLLVVLLTAGAGKVRAAAASARRSKRRFAGGLSGGAIGRATLVPKRGLWRLDAFVPVTDHTALGRDLQRFAYVAYLCELTDVLLVEPEPDAARFDALTAAIATTIDGPAHPGVLRWYELRLLASLGLLPALDRCAVCGRALPDPPDATAVALDERRGGALCDAHAAGAHAVATDVVALGGTLLRDPVTAAAASYQERAASIRKALRDLLQTCIRPHLRRPLRSLDFFAKLGTMRGP